MSLKRHRKPLRTARQPVRIQYQGQVWEIGEPVIFMTPAPGERSGRIVYPWRLTPRQRRRTLDHTRGHARPGTGWRHRTGRRRR